MRSMKLLRLNFKSTNTIKPKLLIGWRQIYAQVAFTYRTCGLFTKHREKDSKI